MKDLVHHGGGHVLQSLSLLFRQVSQAAAERSFQFPLPYLFQPLPQGRNCGDLFQGLDPTDEIVYLFSNDSFRLFSLVRPFLKILFGDALEIIDIVKINIVDFVDSGIEILRSPMSIKNIGFCFRSRSTLSTVPASIRISGEPVQPMTRSANVR